MTLLVEGGGTLHGQLLMQRLVSSPDLCCPRLLAGTTLLNIPGPERMIDGWRLKRSLFAKLDRMCLEGCVVYPEPHRVDDEDV